MDLFLKILLSGFVLVFAGLLFLTPWKPVQSATVVEQQVMPEATLEWTRYATPDQYCTAWVLVLPTGERVFIARSGHGLTSLLLPPLPEK